MVTEESATAAAPVTLRDAAKAIYAGITQEAIEEASRLESVDAEVTLLRIWLRDVIDEKPESGTLMQSLFAQIVRAVSVKYRLSPKRTDGLAEAMREVLEGVEEQIRESRMEEV